MNLKFLSLLLSSLAAGTPQILIAGPARLTQKSEIRLSRKVNRTEQLDYYRQRITTIQRSIALSGTAKITALQSRIKAGAFRYYDSSGFLLSDTAMFTYTGKRGGDLNSEVIRFDEANYYDAQSGALQLMARTNQTFDVSDNLLSKKEQQWNSITGRLENSEQTFSTYTSFNKVASDSVQQWSGGTWGNIYKASYTYNTANDPVEQTGAEWDGSGWINTYRELYSYNASKKLTSFTFQAWSEATASWDSIALTTMSYDASGNKIAELNQLRPAPGSGLLEDESRHTYTYDASNNLIADNYQRWNTYFGFWQNFTYQLHAYDPGNNRVETIQTHIDDSTGRIDTFWHKVFTYNTYGQLLTDKSQQWNPDTRTWETTILDALENIYYEEYTSSSIDEMIAGAGISLFPVPASDVLEVDIQLRAAQLLTISLINIQGHTIYTSTIPGELHTRHRIPVHQLPSGSYFLKINGTRQMQAIRQCTVVH